MNLLRGKHSVLTAFSSKMLFCFSYSFIDIDRIISVRSMPSDQQNNSVFHVITEGRTYELLANDEASMKKYVGQLYMI